MDFLVEGFHPDAIVLDETPLHHLFRMFVILPIA